jgi:hypothetical protein
MKISLQSGLLHDHFVWVGSLLHTVLCQNNFASFDNLFFVPHTFFLKGTWHMLGVSFFGNWNNNVMIFLFVLECLLALFSAYFGFVYGQKPKTS